jgi:glycosyltransferase involved in cell wall biosynthesis
VHVRDDGSTVGIAHDYLTQRGGGERVVLAMTRAFPGAPVHTTLYEPGSTYPDFAAVDVRPSRLDAVGLLRRDHRRALPVLAWAAERVRPTEDVVVASTSGWAHGFSATGRVLAYCHAPARWLHQSRDYLGGPLWGSPTGAALGLLRPMLLRWDRRAADRPERYLCNSRVVRDRIREAYGIDATVLPPPHGMDPDGEQQEVDGLADWSDGGYLLVVSRLLPYKNVDVLVEAVRGTRHRLVVIGAGPLRHTLAAHLPPNVRLLSGLTDAQMRWTYARAALLLAPSLEDFGLTPLEAASFGVPSLSLRAGGYLDTIAEGVTGLHVHSPQPSLVRHGIDEALSHPWDATALREHAKGFSEAVFAARLQAEVDALLAVR